jgi:hypothetical protein
MTPGYLITCSWSDRHCHCLTSLGEIGYLSNERNGGRRSARGDRHLSGGIAQSVMRTDSGGSRSRVIYRSRRVLIYG